MGEPIKPPTSPAETKPAAEAELPTLDVVAEPDDAIEPFVRPEGISCKEYLDTISIPGNQEIIAAVGGKRAWELMSYGDDIRNFYARLSGYITRIEAAKVAIEQGRAKMKPDLVNLLDINYRDIWKEENDLVQEVKPFFDDFMATLKDKDRTDALVASFKSWDEKAARLAGGYEAFVKSFEKSPPPPEPRAADGEATTIEPFVRPPGISCRKYIEVTTLPSSAAEIKNSIGEERFNQIDIRKLGQFITGFNKISFAIEEAKRNFENARESGITEHDNEYRQLLIDENELVENIKPFFDDLMATLNDEEKTNQLLTMIPDLRKSATKLVVAYQKLAENINAQPDDISEDDLQPAEDEEEEPRPRKKIGKGGKAAILGTAVAAGLGLGAYEMHQHREHQAAEEVRQERIDQFHLVAQDPGFTDPKWYQDSTGQYKGHFYWDSETRELLYETENNKAAYLPEHADPSRGWLTEEAHALVSQKGWEADPKHPGFSVDGDEATILTALPDRAILVPKAADEPISTTAYQKEAWANAEPVDLKVYAETMLGVKKGEIHDNRGNYKVTMTGDKPENFQVTAVNMDNNRKAIWNIRTDTWEPAK